MQLGDFTSLAKSYVHRPAYAPAVLRCLMRYVGAARPGFVVADVGAGTGKLTEQLAAFGLGGYAVEPNDAMRAEGMRTPATQNAFAWVAGSGEATSLPDDSVDWVCMASSFHWTDAPRALREFHRIIRPGGHLSLLWNPRDLDNDPFQSHIDSVVRSMIPHLVRHSSGAAPYTADLEAVLLESGEFGDVLYLEAPHAEVMSRERYLGVWQSVNDVQAQAGERLWPKIMAAVESEIAELPSVVVKYRTRAWTVRYLES